MEKQGGNLYRKLPQLGELLSRAEVAKLAQAYSRALVMDAARAVLAHLREEVRGAQHTETSLSAIDSELPARIEKELRCRLRPSLRKVINATGVILQTNLGRAPLSEQAIEAITQVARGYCNLEMDWSTGERSRRDVHAENLILDLLALRTGAAMCSLQETRGVAVVNNCAAATFLALNTLADGGEVIVSRGELVEIGGGFRVPDILRKSGAALREVGTTNRTRIADYAEAISPATRLILRVHRSNFRIEGFTEQPTLREVIELGREASIPVFEDQGSGCVVALNEFGILGESSWIASATSEVDLVSASGDKLLGGPQCGILTGRRDIIERIRSNPLFRAFRVDKLTYAALQATLLAYIAGEEHSIPVVAMMRAPEERILQRCESYVKALAGCRVVAGVVPTRSVVGGGTTPGATLPSFAVSLRCEEMSEGALAALLRHMEPPVIARTVQGQVLLDLRTVQDTEDAALIRLLQSAFAQQHLPVPLGAEACEGDA